MFKFPEKHILKCYLSSHSQMITGDPVFSVVGLFCFLLAFRFFGGMLCPLVFSG